MGTTMVRSVKRKKTLWIVMVEPISSRTLFSIPFSKLNRRWNRLHSSFISHSKTYIFSKLYLHIYFTLPYFLTVSILINNHTDYSFTLRDHIRINNIRSWIWYDSIIDIEGGLGKTNISSKGLENRAIVWNVMSRIREMVIYRIWDGLEIIQTDNSINYLSKKCIVLKWKHKEYYHCVFF